MADHFQELQLTCPRCRAQHVALAVDLVHRTDWVVECGAARHVAVSPPPRDGRVADELLAFVLRDLERQLAAAESAPA